MMLNLINCRQRMKMNKIISLMLGLAVILSSCNVNELHEQGFPEGEYVRLNLSTGDDTASPAQTRAIWEDPNGKGNLGFRWEAVAIDSDETNKLSIILSNGTKALNNQATPAKGAPEGQLTYTGAAVTPNQSDAHLAGFETVRYYSTEDLNTAKYVYAVAGGASITADEERNQHICRLEMPSTFAQVENQNPSFLRDYMYMYAATAYNVGSSTRLKFNHIPATFRFIFNNTKDDMSFESVTVGVVEGGAVASKATDVTFDWTSKEAKLSFSTEGYESLTTTLSGANVQKGAVYTAYSMALPLASNDAFKGKTVIFTAKGNNGVNLSYLLDGETLAKANGSGIYNWVGGKSYTIKFNIGEGGKTTGVMLSNKDITVASTVGGTFTLKYVDASGNPLANYADICTLNLAEMALYDDFIDANMVPATAAAIGIYDEADVKVGSIDINGFKADNSGFLYSVGMLSDVHINTVNLNYGTDAVNDFEKALTFFNSTDVNVAFTCTCGDITEHGTEAELAKYKEIVAAKSTTPVYTTTGNHDCVKDVDAINETLWKQYTGHGLVYEVSKTVNDKTDHYLFLGMSTWKDNMPNPYNTSNLLWLRSKLETYRNERCFVITHLFFPEESGNLLGIYPEGNWLKGSQLNELKEMRARYKNSIWFSGHSHWKWSLQQFEDKANIYKNPSAGWSVHIPSCAKPSDSDGILGSSSARQEKVGLSEGAVINVYENHIDVLGVEFTTGKYLPIATYRLDTTLQPVEEIPVDDTYLKAEDFSYYKGSTNTSVTDVEGMPGYIDVIFNDNGQGYFVKNSTFTSGVESPDQIFDLDIEYLQCWTGWGTSSQTEVATIEKVGFYSGDYNLVSTLNCYVNSVSGVQFQTKSNCDAAFPIKIRMKARGKFYLKDENVEVQSTRITAENFTDNEGKKGAKVENVADKPGYVDMIFYGPQQGFYMKNSTFTYGYDTHYQTVNIGIDDLQCWTGWGTAEQTEVATVAGVGFYGPTYTLSNSSTCYVNAKEGVQFHTKSDCAGPYPIKIRMKATADFTVSSKAPSIYTTAEHFFVNPNKPGATVKDVEGMPDYIDVTFYEKGQGFFIKHHTHSASTTKVDVNIEYAKVITKNADGTEKESDVPAGIAFYGQPVDGTMGYYFNTEFTVTFNTSDLMKDKETVAAKVLCFQLSGSNYEGSYPVTVRMKVSTIFYL